MLARLDNLRVLRKAALELAGRNLRRDRTNPRKHIRKCPEEKRESFLPKLTLIGGDSFGPIAQP